MSSQVEDGWFPECKKCGNGNLGDRIVCMDCFVKMAEELVRARLELQQARTKLKNQEKKEVHWRKW